MKSTQWEVYWPWRVGTFVIACIVALPIVMICSRIGADTQEIWTHLVQTVLSEYIIHTFWLLLGVGSLTCFLGIVTAWFVTVTTFPSVKILEWALFLPLAIPPNIIAYVYTDILDYSGPLQSFLREYGIDVLFPEIRSLGGAIVIMGCVFYPYVYMLSRIAFLNQSTNVLEVSSTLGYGMWGTFWKISLPLARPSIVAGVLLVLMETVADYGTVDYFGIPTFTVGIYRTWFGFGSLNTAAQLAACLLVITVTLILLEAYNRGHKRFTQNSTAIHSLKRTPLPKRISVVVFVLCWLLVGVGFLLPASVLLYFAITVGDPLWGPRFLRLASHSFTLGLITAFITVIIAVFLVYGRRLVPGILIRLMTRISGLGYAIPGSVIAIGVIIPFAALDNFLDELVRASFNTSLGLLLTGTIVGLVFAYVVRFLAIAFNTIDAGFTAIDKKYEEASRSLGRGPLTTLWLVHLPILRGSLLTSFALVFVDVIKELPASLIVRPFNFDTLAIRVYNLASDERLAEASTAALIIVLVSLIPVILLSRTLTHPYLFRHSQN